jgi:hypothetical protein
MQRDHLKIKLSEGGGETVRGHGLFGARAGTGPSFAVNPRNVDSRHSGNATRKVKIVSRVAIEVDRRPLLGTFLMSFLRHEEIYPPMRASTFPANAPAHRQDEFPAGYSLAGCAPAVPASASPAGHHYAVQSFCRARIFHLTANCVLTVCVNRPDKRTLKGTPCPRQRPSERGFCSALRGSQPLHCSIRLTREALAIQ